MTQKEILIHAYNSGYTAGHHDTVEGCYVDVLPCDMTEYHEDVVSELADELYWPLVDQ